jgi:hypothetical protein
MERVGNKSLSADNMAPQGYDTAWAIALALNNTRQQLLDEGWYKLQKKVKEHP